MFENNYYDELIERLKNNEYTLINPIGELDNILNYMVMQELPKNFGEYKVETFIKIKMKLPEQVLSEDMYKDYINFLQVYEKLYTKSLIMIYPKKDINRYNQPNGIVKENVDFFIKNLMEMVRDKSYDFVMMYLEKDNIYKNRLITKTDKDIVYNDLNKLIILTIDEVICEFLQMMDELHAQDFAELNVCVNEKKSDVIFYGDGGLVSEFVSSLCNDEYDWMFKYSKLPKYTIY